MRGVRSSDDGDTEVSTECDCEGCEGPLPDYMADFPFGVVILGFVAMVVYLGFMSFRAGLGISGAAIGLSLAVCGWSGGKLFAEVNARRDSRELRAEVRDLRSTSRDASRRFIDGFIHYDTLEVAANDVVNVARIKDPDAEHPRFEVPEAAMIALENAVTELREEHR